MATRWRCAARRAAAAAAAAFALLPAAASVPAQAAPTEARIVSEQRIDARLRELTIDSPALGGSTKARILLPDGYRSDRRRYPVLYLLNGAGGSETDWTEAGAAASATAGTPLIVVMPDGDTGWYSDWSNGGAGGPPAWETYHVGELIPLIDQRFRTVAARRERAIAGLSMGGFGAFSYAGRHPDLFAAAASYSGGVDLNAELLGQPIGKIAVDGSLALAGHDGVTGETVFGGDFATENILWRAHNPVDLAPNLGGLKLALYTGNGQPGGPFGPDEQDLIEIGAHEMNVNLHRRLERLKLPHVWDDYGPGGHTWPYWTRDLRETIPWLMRRFDHPRPIPRKVTFTAVETRYEAYGWRVRLRRPNAEFSTLSDARRRGFALTGSGHALVRTPPRYRAGAGYLARIRQAGGSTGQSRPVAVQRRRLVATRSGRLRIRLRLAPTNRFDEGSPAAANGPVHSGTVRVAFRRLRGR